MKHLLLLVIFLGISDETISNNIVMDSIRDLSYTFFDFNAVKKFSDTISFNSVLALSKRELTMEVEIKDEGTYDPIFFKFIARGEDQNTHLVKNEFEYKNGKTTYKLNRYSLNNKKYLPRLKVIFYTGIMDPPGRTYQFEIKLISNGSIIDHIRVSLIVTTKISECNNPYHTLNFVNSDVKFGVGKLRKEILLRGKNEMNICKKNPSKVYVFSKDKAIKRVSNLDGRTVLNLYIKSDFQVHFISEETFINQNLFFSKWLNDHNLIFTDNMLGVNFQQGVGVSQFKQDQKEDIKKLAFQVYHEVESLNRLNNEIDRLLSSYLVKNMANIVFYEDAQTGVSCYLDYYDRNGNFKPIIFLSSKRKSDLSHELGHYLGLKDDLTLGPKNLMNNESYCHQRKYLTIEQGMIVIGSSDFPGLNFSIGNYEEEYSKTRLNYNCN